MDSPKIHDKLDQLLSTQADMNVTLAVQAEQLKTHIKRTELAEENIALIRDELKPVQQHVSSVNTLGKAFAVLGAFVGVAAGFVKLLEFFSGK